MHNCNSIRLYFEQQHDKKTTRWQIAFISIYLLAGLAGLVATVMYGISNPRFPWFLLLVGAPYTALGVYLSADLRNESVCA